MLFIGHHMPLEIHTSAIFTTIKNIMWRSDLHAQNGHGIAECSCSSLSGRVMRCTVFGRFRLPKHIICITLSNASNTKRIYGCCMFYFVLSKPTKICVLFPQIFFFVSQKPMLCEDLVHVCACFGRLFESIRHKHANWAKYISLDLSSRRASTKVNAPRPTRVGF